MTETLFDSSFVPSQEQFIRNFAWKHINDLFLNEINGVSIFNFLFKDQGDRDDPGLNETQ